MASLLLIFLLKVCLLTVGVADDSGSHNFTLPCPGDMLQQDSDCINVTQCHREILFDRKCLDQCPEGHVYFGYAFHCDVYNCHYTQSDPDRRPCLRQDYFNLILATVVISAILYAAGLCFFLSTKRISAACFLSKHCLKVSTARNCSRRRRKRNIDEEILINAEEC